MTSDEKHPLITDREHAGGTIYVWLVIVFICACLPSAAYAIALAYLGSNEILQCSAASLLAMGISWIVTGTVSTRFYGDGWRALFARSFAWLLSLLSLLVSPFVFGY